MKPLLFEIGCEEIPARFVLKGLDILQDAFKNLFIDSSIDFSSIKGYGTPRRLALLIENVAEKQKDRTIEATGPPRKIAYDDSGAPTKAAVGFAKSLNLDVNDLVIKKTDRGEYVAATVEEKGRPTAEVLTESLPQLISSLHLPKSMRWGDGSMKFFRPIHWILTLFGNKMVSFELDGLKSGNITYGHRFLSPGAIALGEPAEYLRGLSKNSVIADIEERKKIILKQMQDIASDMKCRIYEDEELLHTVACLVEYPTAVLGSFEEKYLSLPKELPVTVMKAHQKYFSLVDEEGNLMPHFIVISNTASENSEMVRKGAERVIRARLEDARFYYKDDGASPLEDYVEKLRKVTFQEKLGSLYDKTERISSLCSFIADRSNIESKDKLMRAARLCKADLVTGVVGEFPELQGYMGMIYAINSGEDSEAAAAIYEHYLPKSAGDPLPESETGAIVSLADKLDNIASFFSIGLIPTGSEDPFALRRQAAGIINIIQAGDFPFSLHDLVSEYLKALHRPEEDKTDLREKILQFFSQRIENMLLAEGYSYDLVNAVLSASNGDVKNIKSRIDILTAMRDKPGFAGLLTAAKRVYNILQNFEDRSIREDLLSETAEKELLKASDRARDSIGSNNYNSLFELEGPINTFFDDILVMDKNIEIRENRLALLSSVKNLFDSLGDFSKIVEQ
jgi:glycyl-tRNA synthetase beta chain